jgi:hypothetical protein
LEINMPASRDSTIPRFRKGDGRPVYADLADRLARCSEDGPNGCRNWIRYTNASGYGTVKLKYDDAAPSKRRNFLVPRLAWELANGPIPDRLWVLHRCDNPACINPGHLFLGTAKDNCDDKIAKGRDARGETAGNSRLTEADVRAIRADKRIQRVVAAEYGITTSQVGHIRRRFSWRHVK